MLEIYVNSFDFSNEIPAELQVSKCLKNMHYLPEFPLSTSLSSLDTSPTKITFRPVREIIDSL